MPLSMYKKGKPVKKMSAVKGIRRKRMASKGFRKKFKGQKLSSLKRVMKSRYM